MVDILESEYIGSLSNLHLHVLSCSSTVLKCFCLLLSVRIDNFVKENFSINILSALMIHNGIPLARLRYRKRNSEITKCNGIFEVFEIQNFLN